MDGRPPLRCQEETSGPSLYVGAALFSPTRPRHTCSSHHPIPSNTTPSSPYHPWLAPPLSDRRMLAHPVNVLPPLASIQVVVGADALRSGARRSSAHRERYACVLPSCLATAPRLPFMYTCVSDDEVQFYSCATGPFSLSWARSDAVALVGGGLSTREQTTIMFKINNLDDTHVYLRQLAPKSIDGKR